MNTDSICEDQRDLNLQKSARNFLEILPETIRSDIRISKETGKIDLLE
jgi:hypothetical protein